MGQQFEGTVTLHFLCEKLAFGHFSHQIVDHLLGQSPSCYLSGFENGPGGSCLLKVGRYELSHILYPDCLIATESFHEASQRLSTTKDCFVDLPHCLTAKREGALGKILDQQSNPGPEGSLHLVLSQQIVDGFDELPQGTHFFGSLKGLLVEEGLHKGHC